MWWCDEETRRTTGDSFSCLIHTPSNNASVVFVFRSSSQDRKERSRKSKPRPSPRIEIGIRDKQRACCSSGASIRPSRFEKDATNTCLPHFTARLREHPEDTEDAGTVSWCTGPAGGVRRAPEVPRGDRLSDNSGTMIVLALLPGDASLVSDGFVVRCSENSVSHS